MNIIKIMSAMVGVRQDIAELSDKIEERTRKLDLLIDNLIEEMKHKGILETVRVSSKKAQEQGQQNKETQP